jgi:hypothetical protein
MVLHRPVELAAETGKVGSATTDDPYALRHVVSGQASPHRERPISVTGIIDEPLVSGIREAIMDAFANPRNSPLGGKRCLWK